MNDEAHDVVTVHDLRATAEKLCTRPITTIYVTGQRMQFIEIHERLYHVVEPVGCVISPQKQHGPQRKGTRGKIKRW